jgi:hypothetical protein
MFCPNPDDSMAWIKEAHERHNPPLHKRDTLPVGQEYVLQRHPFRFALTLKFSSTGIPVATLLYHFHEQRKVVSQTMETLPFEHLYLALEPLLPPQRQSIHCGYVFLTYETLDAEVNSFSTEAGRGVARNRSRG